MAEEQTKTLRPIRKEEFEAFRKELYEVREGSREFVKPAVELDRDAVDKPKGIAEKLAEVQAHKNRVLVILNRSVSNEGFWESMIDKLDDSHKAVGKQALLTDAVRGAKSAELREAMANDLANKEVARVLLKHEPESGDVKVEIPFFVSQRSIVAKNLAEAIAFKMEVKNIYDNLDDTSRNLAVQLKAVMVALKIGGDPTDENSFTVRGGQ